MTYPLFDEIIAEMKARPEADPVGILDEYISPLVDICNQINQQLDTSQPEPGWYEQFIIRLARFDVDLSPIWAGVREEVSR